MIHDFTYLKPGTLQEALSMLADYKDECKIICGGQSLLIVMRQGLVVTDYLIDIKGLNELSYITYDEKEGLKIGATTTHRTIEKSELVKQKYPILVEIEKKACLNPDSQLGYVSPVTSPMVIHRVILHLRSSRLMQR